MQLPLQKRHNNQESVAIEPVGLYEVESVVFGGISSVVGANFEALCIQSRLYIAVRIVGLLRFFLLRLCFAFILQGYEKVPVIHVVLFVIESAFLPRYDCRRYEVAFLGIGRIVLILSFEFGGVVLVERRLSVSWLRGCDLLLGCRLRGLSGNLLCLLRLLLGLLLLCELIVDLRFAFVKLFENVFERRLGALSMFDLIGVAVYVCMLLRLRVGVVFISAQFLLFLYSLSASSFANISSRV